MQHENSLAVPVPVIVAGARPAIFSNDGSGQGQGLVYAVDNGVASALADASHPVKPADRVIIYCAGLGELDPQGAALHTVSVSIGGQPAQVT